MIVEELAGTQTVTGGFIDASRSRFELVPILYAWATPSGVIASDTLQVIVSALERGVMEARPLDGVLVELHGAAVVEPGVSADGLIARRVRELVGETPIVTVVDPHANLPAAVVEASDGVLAYQTNPHVDMADRGGAAVELLGSILRCGRRPARAFIRVPVVAPAIAQATDDLPLSELVRLAGSIEAGPGIDAASVLFGFAYADVEELGVAALVVGSDSRRAEAAALRLSEACWAGRGAFARHLPHPRAAVELAAGSAGLTVLADTGDNVGGGSPGDSTHVVAEALAHPTLRSVSTIADREAVARAVRAGVGARVEVALGNPRLHVTATVAAVGDGRYVNQGPLSAGVTFDMGVTAVLEAGKDVIVVQSKPVMANDQNLIRSVGLRPEDFDAVILKGAAAVRAGWKSVARRFVDVASLGPTTSDLSLLRYSRCRRPIWPLDDLLEWAPSRSERFTWPEAG